MKGSITKAEVKETKQGKSYLRLEIESEGGKRWYSCFEQVDLKSGDEVEFEATRKGEFWNVVGVRITGSHKVTEETVSGKKYDDRSMEIRYLALLKVGAICVAHNAKTANVAITAHDLVVFTNDLEKEAFGDG